VPYCLHLPRRWRAFQKQNYIFNYYSIPHKKLQAFIAGGILAIAGADGSPFILIIADFQYRDADA
jgi:hypothetical protein